MRSIYEQTARTLSACLAVTRVSGGCNRLLASLLASASGGHNFGHSQKQLEHESGSTSLYPIDKQDEEWWAVQGSNLRPPACKADFTGLDKVSSA